MAKGLPKRALTQLDLAYQMCDEPDCLEEHELFMVQDCHPQRGLEIKYTKVDGVATVCCIICGRRIAQLQLAKGGDDHERSD